MTTTGTETVYDIGDQPTLVATFVDVDDVLTDPGAITVTVRDPAGTEVAETQAAASNPSVGVWRWPLPTPFDAAGFWYLRAEATSGIQTAGELTVRVRPSHFD